MREVRKRLYRDNLHFQFQTVCLVSTSSMLSINFLSSPFLSISFLFFSFLLFRFPLILIRYQIFALHPPRYIHIYFCSFCSFLFFSSLSRLLLSPLPYSILINFSASLHLWYSILFHFKFLLLFLLLLLILLRVLPIPFPILNTNLLSWLSGCLSNAYFTFYFITPYWY